MKTQLLIIVAIGSLLFSHCVPSIHPLYTSDQLIFEPALIGSWAEEEGDQVWKVQKRDDQSYLIKLMEANTEKVFEAHLIQLNEHFFVDLYPFDESKEGFDALNDIYGQHFLKAHTFYQIALTKDKLKVKTVSTEWLEKQLIGTGSNLSYISNEDHSIILTSDSKELQAFILNHIDNPKAFEESTVLNRLGK